MPLLNPSVQDLWLGNSIVSGVARDHASGSVKAPLSIKTVRGGEAFWFADGREFRVIDDSFLIVNQDQEYEMFIDSATPVETFCLFFKPGSFESIAAASMADAEGLLDLKDTKPIGFYERLSPMTDPVRRAVQAGRLLRDDDFIFVAEHLLDQSLEIPKQRQALQAARESTRDEVFRRLEIARDYLIANMDQNVPLEEVALTAFLSPYHFHRLFRMVFGVTPHGFLTGLRMDRAKRLLENSELDLARICSELGYSSVSSFSRTFKGRFGVNPGAFRKIGQTGEASMV